MKKLIELLSTAALLIVLAMTALLVGVRLIGLTPYSVLSGSMEPTYSVGDLIYVKEIAPEEIEIGMPITYVANEHLVIATHRVVDIAVRTTKMEPIVDQNGKAAVGSDGQPIMQEVELEEPAYYFMTRGDANPDADAAAVYDKNVIGTPVYAIPYLGYFTTMLQTTAGKVMAACFGLVIVLLLFLPEMLQAIEKRENKGKEDASSQEKADEPADETAADGEDVLVCDEHAAKGEDVVEAAEDAAAGEDRLIDAP